MKKIFFFSFFLLLLFAVFLGLSEYRKFKTWSDISRPLAEKSIVEFPRGTSLNSLADILENKGVISDALFFRLFVKYESEYQKFQAGTYLFQDSVSPKEVVASFIAGDTYEPVVLEFTVPEGFTTKKFISRLVAKGVADKKTLTELTTDISFLKELGISSTSIEGFIYPATYSFAKMPSAREAIKKTVDEFWKRLPKSYVEQAKAKGLSLERAVTFASLIELETHHDHERALVSEVIWNRLKKDDALAIDATIIYGIPDFDGNIRFKHLRDAKNPYNSRIHKGLPPTPIGSPSLASLQAVLEPSNKGYYFYVIDVDSINGNQHHFSKTLREHNQFVKKLVKRSRENRRRKK